MRTLVFLFFSFSLAWAECPPALQGDKKLCGINKRYAELKNIYKKKFGVDMEYLTRYRALRFIKDEHWDARSKDLGCAPWEFYPPKPKSWVFWEKGAARSKQLANKKNRSKKMPKLEVPLMQDFHQHAMDASLLGLMPKLKGAGPGVIRDGSTLMRPGFTVGCKDKDIDENAYKLLKDYDLKDSHGKSLVSFSVGDAASLSCKWMGGDKKYYAGIVEYMDSSLVKDELQKMISSTNKKFEKLESKEATDYNALDTVADLQRWFVSIHPFGDGNGRTSRYLQDYYTESLGLPYLSSGSLQFDVFKSQEDYRKEVAQSMDKSMEYFEGCLKEYESKKSVEELSCDCRPLYSDFEEVTPPKNENVEEEVNKKCQNPMGTISVDQNIEGFQDILIWLVDNEIYEDDDL